MEPDQPILSALALTSLLVLASPAAQAAAEAAWSCRPEEGGNRDCVQAQSGTAMAELRTEAPSAPSYDAVAASAAFEAETAPDSAVPAEKPVPSEADAAASDRGASSSLSEAGAPAGNGMWALCKPWPPLLAPVQFPAPSRAQRETEPVQIFADQVEVTRERLSTYRGDVTMQRADQQMRADEASYDAATEQFRAEGDVRYREEAFSVTGSSAEINLGTNQGEFADAEYRVETRHAHGSASKVVLESADVSQLSRVTYTTCDPGDDDWELRARRVTLDKAEGMGAARDVTVSFEGVPFLYSPYLSFPIDDRRRSGFLVPSIGSSSATGLDLSIPYYWNIAPHRDATFTPRIMADRGVQMLGEFRYLNPTNQGVAQLEYLPNDNITDTDRGALFYRHSGILAPRWTTDINLNYVSDNDYLEDFGSTINLTSATHLERRADVTYHGDGWYLLSRADGYQTVDEAVPRSARPYYRLPQFLLGATFPDRRFGLSYRLHSELVNFQRDDGVTGTRLDLKPSISLPMGGAAYSVIPTAALRHTQYQLDNTAPDASANPSRTLPSFSLDSGLFFERDLQWKSTPLVQTLEPRLFYLYVPFRNQDNLIVDESGQDVVFDTSPLTFSFARMFADNRFTGADRVSDANQVTFALTSRLLHAAEGSELLRASIGQIYYFENPRVTLPGTAPIIDDSSDILGELSARLASRWTATTTVQWDPHEEETERSIFRVQYRPDQDRLVNFSYRLLRDEFLVGEDLEQTDVAVLWPLTRRWHVIGRWLYSLEDKRDLETLAGIEYESCCWALRVVGRRYATDTEAETNSAIYLQLVLKGLGNIGQDIDQLLKNDILGYESSRVR